MPTNYQALKTAFTAVILFALLAVADAASAAGDSKKQSPPPKPAPAARPATQPARPAGNPGGGFNRPAANGPSANRPHVNNPSANRPTANNPSFNRPTNNPINRAGGGFTRPAPRGVNEHVAANGSLIRTRSNGHIADMHDARRGMDVHHGLNGNRRISFDRPDHSRIVAERGRPGFVQRPYSFHGHDFARRTYFYHGREYSHFYHGYPYRGVYLNVYAPGFYYRPAFYGWAYNRWGVPVVYAWGWGGNPWFGYYGYYFQPYPVYPSAAFWLTDYIVSTDLQTAYAAQQEGGEEDGASQASGGQPVLTPEVKQQISDEVRDQLALENQEAGQNAQGQDVDPGSSGIARLLSDGKPHVFVVGSALDVVDASQTECALSDGDVLGLSGVPPVNAAAVDLTVLASKGGQECAKQDTVSVAVDDLQEMQNQMRETIDQGLQELQAKQGSDGIPTLPPSAQGQPAPAEYAAAAPPPDPDAAAEIQQQTQLADQAENEATSNVPQSAPAAVPPPPPAATGTVTLGQSISDVESILGQPTSKAMLGSKVIYNYNGMKVIFKDGKVSDVQ